MKRAALSLVCFALLGFAQVSFANPVGGAFSGSHRVDAYSTDVLSVLYQGGEQADFQVTGDHTTTLNVIVRDQFGNIVASTSGPGDNCHVYWQVRNTSTYNIEVRNEGNVWNRFSYRAY